MLIVTRRQIIVAFLGISHALCGLTEYKKCLLRPQSYGWHVMNLLSNNIVKAYQPVMTVKQSNNY